MRVLRKENLAATKLSLPCQSASFGARFARLWATLGLVGIGCQGKPEDKLVNWPPQEPVIPAHLIPEPEPEPELEPEPAPPPVQPPAPPPLQPCEELLGLACEFWTPHADACREARASKLDDSHGPTREACQQLVARYRKEDAAMTGNPCGRYVRMLCANDGRGYGPNSEYCKSAQSRLPLLNKRYQWRACLGDMLWFETRGLRH